jgi:hypothetical protein
MQKQFGNCQLYYFWVNVNMLWCFSYGTADGILNVGWLHWKQLLKIQVD